MDPEAEAKRKAEAEAAAQALAEKQAEDAAGDAKTRKANTFTATLKPMHADYLRRRAADHGQSPDEHLAAIVMLFWAHHDDWRRSQMAGAARPGAVAIAP